MKARTGNSEIFERKARGRRQLAALSFREKLAKLEKLRERSAAFKASRRSRKEHRQD